MAGDPRAKLRIRYDKNAPYPYNPLAARLLRVRAKLGSREASLDIPRAGSKTAKEANSYRYILEVDADGDVIGGEWLGDSKPKHPDFAWVPYQNNTTFSAGGKIQPSNVLLLQDQSD